MVDRANAKAQVEARAIFPTVSRAIDRTHMKASSEVEFDFVNRKPSHSINVQMICDAEMRLTNIVSRWPGSEMIINPRVTGSAMGGFLEHNLTSECFVLF